MRSFSYLKQASEQQFPEEVLNAIKYTGARPYKTQITIPSGMLNHWYNKPIRGDMLDQYNNARLRNTPVTVSALRVTLPDFNRKSPAFLNRYRKFKEAYQDFDEPSSTIMALNPLFKDSGRVTSPYINSWYDIVMTKGRPFSSSYYGMAALNPAYTREKTGAANEEVYQHYINRPAQDYTIIPQGLGGDEGSKAMYRKAPMQSYIHGAKNYSYNKWAYPKGHPATIDLQKQAMTWKPSAYSLRSAEFTKSLGMLKDKLERDYGAKFNNFSEVLPYLRKNGFYKGGRIDESKLMRKEYGSLDSPLYGEIFGLQRDLSDGLHLAKAAYRRDPRNPIARRNYEHAKLMHDRYMKEADHYWDQLHTSSMSKKQ